MIYWIFLHTRKGMMRFEDAFLPGIIPERVLSMCRANFAYELGLCKHCEMAWRCHVIDSRGNKYCTILFHDVVKPGWKLEQVL